MNEEKLEQLAKIPQLKELNKDNSVFQGWYNALYTFITTVWNESPDDYGSRMAWGDLYARGYSIYTAIIELSGGNQ